MVNSCVNIVVVPRMIAREVWACTGNGVSRAVVKRGRGGEVERRKTGGNGGECEELCEGKLRNLMGLLCSFLLLLIMKVLSGD